MNRRYELQELLENILASNEVYYQPPENIKMKYPAIIYSRQDIDNRSADNLSYMQEHSYNIIVIDKNPDSIVVDKVSKIPRCRFDRHYVSDSLNHDIFTIFY